MTQPIANQDEPRVTRDLLCLRCGYNLRTRTLADVCPNCGIRVTLSTDFERTQPSLAAGSRALAMGAMAMVGLEALNFVVHLLSNVTQLVLGRLMWVRIFDPTLAIVRALDVGLLILIVICFARSRLSPPALRRGMPLSGLLVLGLAGVVVTTLVLGCINLVEFQAAGRISLTLFRTRHIFFLLQTITHLPLLICGFLYFINLTRRPEFAGFRVWLHVLFWMGCLFWTLFGAMEINYLVALFVTFRQPAEEVYNLMRMVDWVQLAWVLPEIVFWSLLARRAWNLRPEQTAPV